jgi:hypothetical protein
MEMKYKEDTQNLHRRKGESSKSGELNSANHHFLELMNYETAINRVQQVEDLLTISLFVENLTAQNGFCAGRSALSPVERDDCEAHPQCQNSARMTREFTGSEPDRDGLGDNRAKNCQE